MRINELLAGPRPVFSFEFFPPKTDRGEQNLYAALRELKTLEPSFVSVTYGAGGSTREKTIEIVKRIKREYGLEAMAHFTCVGATVEQLRGTLDEMVGAGVENVLALRGDPPAGQEAWVKTDGGLEYSGELVTLVRSGYPFAIGAACFPETHIHATSPEEDLEHLAEKVRAGVDFLITQLFFDNARYFDFLERARSAGIEVPIIPGIMPITQVGQIERMAAMCGASIPEGLRRELHLREESPEAVLDFGVAYATLQCSELLAGGAPGIHFYTLNRSPATRAILGALKLARPWERAEGRHPASGPARGAAESSFSTDGSGQASSISSPSATRGEPSGAS
jgi:methylenetetrahydrofolate reductase (NADPH)